MASHFLAAVNRRREARLPSVRRRQRSLGELLPQHLLGEVKRTRVAQKKHITQAHGCSAIVLGELIGVELHERRGQTLLDLRGERLLPVLPVNADELSELVGALDDARERWRDQRTMRRVASHLTHQQQRHMTQVHTLPRFDSERSDGCSFYLRDKGRDTLGSHDAILIERILPQEAGKNSAAQRGFRAEDSSRRALVGARNRPQVQVEEIQTRHDMTRSVCRWVWLSPPSGVTEARVQVAAYSSSPSAPRPSLLRLTGSV